MLLSGLGQNQCFFHNDDDAVEILSSSGISGVQGRKGTMVRTCSSGYLWIFFVSVRQKGVPTVDLLYSTGKRPALCPFIFVLVRCFISALWKVSACDEHNIQMIP